MFNKRERKLHLNTKTNTLFLNTGKLVTMYDCMGGSTEIVTRICNFMHYFLKGVSSVKSKDKYVFEYYLYKTKVEIYKKNGFKINSTEQDYELPLNKFYLLAKDGFFKRADYAIITAYVTFGEKARIGRIIKVKINF